MSSRTTVPFPSGRTLVHLPCLCTCRAWACALPVQQGTSLLVLFSLQGSMMPHFVLLPHFAHAAATIDAVTVIELSCPPCWVEPTIAYGAYVCRGGCWLPQGGLGHRCGEPVGCLPGGPCFPEKSLESLSARSSCTIRNRKS